LITVLYKLPVMVIYSVCTHSNPRKVSQHSKIKKPASLMATKLSRKKISEGLNNIPMATLLLGTQSKQTKLTAKQKAFAKELALGETKAGAYRKVYSQNSKPKTAGNAGSKLAQHSGIAMEVQAIQAALEAQAYQNPAQLRALVIHQLTQHSLNEDVPYAQRIKALQLLGTVNGVDAFIQRSESVNVTQSGDIKARLLERLQSVMQSQSINVIDITPSKADDAESLLAEIADTNPLPDSTPDSPTGTPPPEATEASRVTTTHTIPHTESPIESIDQP